MFCLVVCGTALCNPARYLTNWWRQRLIRKQTWRFQIKDLSRIGWVTKRSGNVSVFQAFIPVSVWFARHLTYSCLMCSRRDHICSLPFWCLKVSSCDVKKFHLPNSLGEAWKIQLSLTVYQQIKQFWVSLVLFCLFTQALELLGDEAGLAGVQPLSVQPWHCGPYPLEDRIESGPTLHSPWKGEGLAPPPPTRWSFGWTQPKYLKNQGRSHSYQWIQFLLLHLPRRRSHPGMYPPPSCLYTLAAPVFKSVFQKWLEPEHGTHFFTALYQFLLHFVPSAFQLVVLGRALWRSSLSRTSKYLVRYGDQKLHHF